MLDLLSQPAPLRAHFDRYCVMNRRRLCTVNDLCEVTWTAL